MLSKKILRILLVAIGIIAGILIYDFPKSSKSYPNTQILVNPATSLAEVNSKISQHKQEISLLSVRDSLLRISSRKANESIVRKKRIDKEIRNKVKTSIDSLSSNAVLLSDSTFSKNLQIDVSELLSNSEDIDSIYAQLINTLEDRVKVKDTIISIQERRDDLLKKSLTDAYSQQQLLYNENVLLQKSIKKHNRKNKILAGVLLILGGAVTYTLLQH